MEAKAFKASFTFVVAVGIRDFVIEGDTDSLNIVQALRGESPPPSSVAPLIYGMFAVVNDFWSIHFSYVCRISN